MGPVIEVAGLRKTYGGVVVDDVSPLTLSDRELEVLGLVRHLTNRVIAERRFVTEVTVKSHLVHVFAKFGVDDRTAAVMVALERGLLRLDS